MPTFGSGVFALGVDSAHEGSDRLGVTTYRYDRGAERVVERQQTNTTAQLLPSPPDVQEMHRLMSEMAQQLDREMRDAMYGDRGGFINQLQFVTIPNRPDYHIPGPVMPIQELWLEQYGAHHLLQQLGHGRQLRSAAVGRPVYFYREANLVFLWPTPDAEYRIGFIQGEARRPRGQYQANDDFVGLSTNNLASEKKAIDLLKEWLSPEQRTDYDAHQSFTVTGSVTSKRYRIHPRSIFNVEELSPTGERVRSLCFVPTTAYAIGDIMLAQKIMLEQREDEALAIANFSAPNGGIIPRSSLYDELCQVTRRAFVRSRVINEGPMT